jgi:replicative DNA helicase
LREEKKPIDLVTLTAELQDRKMLDEVGGVPYLTSLINGVPTTANVEHYAQIVEEKAIRRHLIRQASQTVALAYEGENIEVVMTNTQEQMQNIQDRAASSTKSRIKDIKSLLMNSFERIEERSLNKSGISGIPTGFPNLDTMLNGLSRGDLIILAARPSMGKTAFALNVAINVALQSEKPGIIFNLEMTGEQLSDRMFASQGNIDFQAIRTGRLTSEEWERLTMAISTLSEAPLTVIDEAFTLNQIRSDARKLKREIGELGVIVIDYLQLIGVEGNFSTTNDRVSYVSRTLKLLARELDVPIIALSQLSRAVEQRQDKRPMLSDLRDSGSIEQDADVVAFLYRDDYYNEDSEKKNIAELIIGKQRNGPVGTCELLFLKNYSKFLPLDIQR